jgi:hypothetical protein
LEPKQNALGAITGRVLFGADVQAGLTLTPTVVAETSKRGAMLRLTRKGGLVHGRSCPAQGYAATAIEDVYQEVEWATGSQTAGYRIAQVSNRS